MGKGHSGRGHQRALTPCTATRPGGEENGRTACHRDHCSWRPGSYGGLHDRTERVGLEAYFLSCSGPDKASFHDLRCSVGSALFFIECLVIDCLVAIGASRLATCGIGRFVFQAERWLTSKCRRHGKDQFLPIEWYRRDNHELVFVNLPFKILTVTSSASRRPGGDHRLRLEDISQQSR
jgi:hypothetical protein